MSLAEWCHALCFGREPLPPASRQELGAKHPDPISAGADLIRPKPRLAMVHIAPSRDEFAAWRDEPTTLFVMGAIARNAEECREEWVQRSWERGEADQRTLDALRERSDALLGFTAGYEAFCEVLGLEPERTKDDG